eukprot:10704683-Lingulodinium_polyedra.AAC.1
MAGINAQLDALRVRLLSLKPPMGRVQSACQRRDRARAALAAAQRAAEEARQKAQRAEAEVLQATEQLELAEVELREAGGAVASEAPPPPMASVINDLADRAAAAAGGDLAATLGALRRLTE